MFDPIYDRRKDLFFTIYIQQGRRYKLIDLQIEEMYMSTCRTKYKSVWFNRIHVNHFNVPVFDILRGTFKRLLS